jgi:hypothetical protein
MPKSTEAATIRNGAATGATSDAMAAPPSDATIAYIVSAAATPSAAPAPIRSDVRAARLTMNTPIAPTGMATP